SDQGRVDPAERSPLRCSDFKKSYRQKEKKRGNANENPEEKRFARWRRRRLLFPPEPKKDRERKRDEPPIVVLFVDRPFAAELFAKVKSKRRENKATEKNAAVARFCAAYAGCKFRNGGLAHE